jgi:F-type H+-transporting ATPase subunit b
MSMMSTSSAARAALVAAFVLVLPAPVFAQDEVMDDEVVEHADIEGGGHGEHPGHTTSGHHKAGPPLPVNWYQWHAGKDIKGGELTGDEEPMPPGVLFALVNFAIFFGLLIKFAGPKLTAYLRGHHDTVKGQLEEAARLRADARSKLDEYNRRIAAVDAEVNKLMAEIRAETEAEREMILSQARAQAEALKKDAQRRIEAEIARARLTLEREVAVAAVAAAEKILRERTTSDDQAHMFGNFIDALLAGPPGAQPEQASKLDEEWS